MATMGRFCKAYPVQRLREFSGWKENLQNLSKERRANGEEEIATPRELTRDDHLYLQENFYVTDGISLDENIVFDDVTPDWIEFCQNHLKFEVPIYEPVSTEGKPLHEDTKRIA